MLEVLSFKKFFGLVPFLFSFFLSFGNVTNVFNLVLTEPVGRRHWAGHVESIRLFGIF